MSWSRHGSSKGKAGLLRVFQVLRPGQEPRVLDPEVTTDAGEEKGAFQSFSTAAGYAPVEPVSGSSPAPDAAGAGPAE